MKVHSIRDPLEIGQAAPGDPPRRPSIGGAHYTEDREKAKMEFLMAKLSAGTRVGYDGAWKQWALFCRARGRDPYLLGNDKYDRHQDEELILDFVVHAVQYFHRTEGTVKAKLFGVRFHHLAAGLEDPLLHKGRVWLALAGVKRLQGGAARKFPVTLEMLLWLHAHLKDDVGDNATEWAALSVAFFFLLRAGEYVAVDGAPWQVGRALCGADVQARKEGIARDQFDGADEVIIHIRGSKTDQYNRGTLRNMYTTGQKIDHVAALARLQRQHPERWQQEKGQPLFRSASGRMLKRSRIQELLGMAASACGIDPARMGSHSLRIGGATALYKAGVDVETIKRIGRWSSSAVHAYLWDTHERQKGMAAKMVQEDGMLIGSGATPEGYQENPKEARASAQRRKQDRRESGVRARTRAGREESEEIPEGGPRPPPSEGPGKFRQCGAPGGGACERQYVRTQPTESGRSSCCKRRART